MGRGRFGGAWGKGKFGNFWNRHMSAHPPVNIEENDNEFIISLIAAGLSKEKIALTVKNDMLTISYPGTDAESNPAGNYSYQEYRQGGFERQFQLNNKVLTESISASYTDGVLKVTLPKNPETNIPAQTISVQ